MPLTVAGYCALVDKILAITKDNDYVDKPAKQAKAHEHHIDHFVYQLYNFTNAEIVIIKKNPEPLRGTPWKPNLLLTLKI